MTNAKRDQNNVPAILGIREDGSGEIIPIQADPAVHALEVNDNTTGTDYGPEVALRDGNFVPTLLAVSSVDGSTPVAVYATVDGKILIDSN